MLALRSKCDSKLEQKWLAALDALSCGRRATLST